MNNVLCKKLLIISIIYISICFPLLSKDYPQIKLNTWQLRQIGTEIWLPSEVPGTVHMDLLENKLIPDPFYSDNEKTLQWYENGDWEYKTIFKIENNSFQHNELVFEGLDTYAEVRLNGKIILNADNMFRRWAVDIKKDIVEGENQLVIRFSSAVKRGKELASKLPYKLPGEERVFTRKAQYQYGWDFSPRFVTCGIWRPVYINMWNDIKIREFHIVQKFLDSNIAKIRAEAEIFSDSAGVFNLNIRELKIDSLKISQPVKLKKGFNKISLDFNIDKPRFWWTAGLGEAFIYDFAASVTKENKSYDSTTLAYGLRNIKLIQQKDAKGKSFYFEVNGILVFAKGANWTPTDNFLPRTKSKKYSELITLAENAHINMLRVWGGGSYEDDEFYNLCDKKGILVWQDFMFACSMYPGDKAFLDNVKEEITDNIKRLRNHPSIALWCGNNEIDEGWHNWDWQNKYHYSKAVSAKLWKDYRLLFQKLIPDLVKEYIPGSNYIPSSPSIGWGHKESLAEGDSHYWGVWWGKEDIENYKSKVGRFVSEYGVQSMPSITTLKTFTLYDSLNFESVAIENHQKYPDGYKPMLDYISRNYRKPKDFESTVYLSQLMQAEAMTTAIEAHRRAIPNCMGSLFWQFNDCWPGTSWSAVDYNDNPKALFYYLTRLYDDLLISVKKESTIYNIYLISDKLKSYKGKLEMKIKDFTGEILWEQSLRTETPVNSSQVLYSISEYITHPFPQNKIYLECSFIFDSVPEVRYNPYPSKCIFYFASPKDVDLSSPDIRLQKLSNSEIEISTNVLAKNVYLYFEDKEANININYFDLLPGERKKIKFYDQGLEDPKVLEFIKIKTLLDSY